MPSKEKCAEEWSQLGYKSIQDCILYGQKGKGNKKSKVAKDVEEAVKNQSVKYSPK